MMKRHGHGECITDFVEIAYRAMIDMIFGYCLYDIYHLNNIVQDCINSMVVRTYM
jgi:hypothetical protein